MVATGAVILPIPETKKTPLMKIRPASARASLIGTEDCLSPAGIVDVGGSTMARFPATFAAAMARQIPAELRPSASMRTPE
jgi:hypothetical protein